MIAERGFFRRRSFRFIVISLAVLCACAALFFPLFWIVVTALKGQAQALKSPLSFVPRPFMLMENLRAVWGRADWPLHYANSLILALGVWAAQMLVALPASYAFGFMRFRGRRLLLLLILTRLLAPPESAMLANYLTVLRIGAYDSLAGIALPYLVSAQAVFMFSEAFRQMPPGLRDSARMDGCGDFHFLIRIGVPAIGPFIASFSVMTGVFQWNAFFWPMLITRSPSRRVLPVALTLFGMQAESGAEWPLTMTAVLLVSVPLLMVFIIFNKQFTNGFIKSWTS